MAQLLLQFEVETHRLIRTEFRSSASSPPLISIRARDSTGSGVATGTFQWSPAVRALSLLFLRYYFSKVAEAPEGFSVLKGANGSAAASLDYALGKQPIWLSEMFGTTPSGDLYARTFIKRINPERKNGGDVTLFVHRNQLPIQNLALEWGTGEPLSESDTRLLISELEQDTTSPKSRVTNVSLRPAAPPPSWQNSNDMYDATRRLLTEWIDEELSTSIFSTEVFSRFSQNQLCGRIRSDHSIKHFFGKHRDGFKEFFDFDDASALFSRAELREAITEPLTKIRFFTTIAQVGAIAIFSILQRHFGLDLEIVLDSPHTPALLRRSRSSGMERGLEVFSLALGAAGLALDPLNHASVRPVSVVPGVSYELVGRSFKGNGDLRGELFLFGESKSTSSLYYRSLNQSGLLAPRAVRISPCDPNETLAQMSEKSERCGAVLWFPHTRVNRFLCGSDRMIALREQFGMSESFLFARTESPALRHQLRRMVRYAWLQLRVDAAARQQIAKEIASREDYFQAFLSFTGFHAHLPRVPSLLERQAKGVRSY